LGWIGALGILGGSQEAGLFVQDVGGERDLSTIIGLLVRGMMKNTKSYKKILE